MTNEEKIIELLMKNSFTIEEESFLNNELSDNKEFAKFKVIYNLLNNVGNSFHLTSDLIAEYVLYKNGLPAQDKSIIKLLPKIEKHITNCDKCKNEFELFNGEYINIDSYISEKLSKSEADEILQLKENSTQKTFKLFTKKYYFAAAAAIVLFMFSVFDFSQYTVPSYKNLSQISELSDFSFTRGRVSLDFYNGLKALDNNDYKTAIEMLQTDIRNNSNDQTIFYTNYILGLIYLKKSESNFLGLFKSFNYSDVDSSIANFRRSITKNKSSSFANINYNSYFYIGKAYLLKNDFQNAQSNLQVVMNNKGEYYKNAKDLISKIQSE